jgi:hypothetical protein
MRPESDEEEAPAASLKLPQAAALLFQADESHPEAY